MKTLPLVITLVLLVLIIDNSASAQIGKPFNMKIESPSMQFQSGVKAQYVMCQPNYLILVIKIEDNSPACVKPDTAKKLMERGWAESLASFLESPIKKMNIIGLDGNYKVGQPINATVEYTGYESGGVYPDVRILDVNNDNKV